MMSPPEGARFQHLAPVQHPAGARELRANSWNISCVMNIILQSRHWLDVKGWGHDVIQVKSVNKPELAVMRGFTDQDKNLTLFC